MTTPPNIIWFFTDQQRAQTLGLNGDPNVRTPNIDAFANESVVFDGAVGGCPLCCPYRGSLLSGRYPHHAVPGHEYPLPEGMPTIATPFNEAGYHTAWLGKWHVDGHHEWRGDGRAAFHTVAPHRRGGFRHWLGYENNNLPWDCHVHGHDDAGHEIPRYQLPEYEADALTTLLIDYLRIRSEDGQPFFCAMSMQPPHDPYKAPALWMQQHRPENVTLRENVPNVSWVVDQARRDLAGYHAMIENIDWNVGRVLESLGALGLLANTHVIFLSDHGDMHGSHGLFRKTNPYEESIRVPFIIGGGPGGKSGRVKVPINHVDVGPTTLGLCGIDTPDWMCGHDYSAHRLADREPGDEPDSAYLQLVAPTYHGDSTDRAWRGVVTCDGWKYVCFEGQPWLMFDLNRDPYEQVNLAHNRAFVKDRTRLEVRLKQWIDQTGDTFAMPTDLK